MRHSTIPSRSATRAGAVACIVFAMAGFASAGQPSASSAMPSRNVYAVGGEVRPGAPVAGDLVAAGGRIIVERPVAGDAALAGGAVDIRAPIGGDLRAAGGSVNVEQPVGGELVAAGGDITLRPGTRVGGEADLRGGRVVVQGRVDGDLVARAQTIVIDGELRGHSRLAGERIELGPQAKVLGPLVYASPSDLGRAAGAVVEGTVTREGQGASGAARGERPRGGGGFSPAGFIALYVALFATVSLGVMLMPGSSQGVARQLRSAPLKSLGTGLLVLALLPVLTVLLMVTLFGIPLALVLLMAYPLLPLLGFGVAVVCATELLSQALRSPAPERLGGRLGRLALGLLVMLLVAWVPVLGALLLVLASTAGLGSVVLYLRARRAAATGGMAAGQPRQDSTGFVAVDQTRLPQGH